MPHGSAAVAEEHREAGSEGAKPALTAFLGAEAAGAFAALIVALPQALSLGVLAFAVLGPQYAGAGVVAALLAVVVGNLVATGSYAVKCQLVGPRSAATALFAGLMAAAAAHPSLLVSGSPDVSRVLAVAFAAVALAGVLQLGFGVAGFGRAIKYVPYPVVAGFMNGVAIVIVLSQVRAVLGLEGSYPLAATLSEIGMARWGSIATAIATLAVILLLPRWTRRVPMLVGGLIAGIVTHYAVAAVAPAAVGGVVGPLPDARALLGASAGMVHAVPGLVEDASLLQLVLAQAVLLAVVGALDGLLAAVTCDAVTGGRHDSNRVLVGQGLGNLAGGLLGALPAQINSHTPLANFAAGGRTRLATFLHAVFALSVLVAFAPAVSYVPIAALTGVMLYIAYALLDRWSSELLRRVAEGRDSRAEIVLNVAIVGVVTAAQVTMNVMAALAIGLASCVLLLLAKLSGSPVRRHLDGAARASHKVRSPEARERLRAMAARIRVMELHGELFFGTADHLQSEVEAVGGEARFVILDLRRVHQIDATGGRALQVIAQRARRRGVAVLLSEIRPDDVRGRYLRALGLEAAIPLGRWFPDLDRALEWAEDQLLGQERFAEDEAAETPLARMSLFHGLSPEELARVAGLLERVELAGGEPVFREGDKGDRLYLLARGAVSIKMRVGEDDRARRLVTFAPGVMFGEVALVEGKARSADAFAKGERVVLYTLTSEAIERLVRDEPLLASRIYANLSRELAARLRATTNQLRALE